jgi:hypothetical protein
VRAHHDEIAGQAIRAPDDRGYRISFEQSRRSGAASASTSATKSRNSFRARRGRRRRGAPARARSASRCDARGDRRDGRHVQRVDLGVELAGERDGLLQRMPRKRVKSSGQRMRLMWA